MKLKSNRPFTTFHLISLICFFSLIVTATAKPIPFPKFAPENNETSNEQTASKDSTTTKTIVSTLPTEAKATFTNPSNLATAVTGHINFTAISPNKTSISGKLDSGIYDPVAKNYQFKIIDRSKKLLYDLTALGLTDWSVKVPGTTPFQYDFEKLPIGEIVEQFFEISHHKKGTVGMTMIKAI